MERRDPTDEVDEDEEMDDGDGESAEEDPSVNGAGGESDDEESDVDDTNDDDDDAAVLREKLQAVFGDAEVGTDEDESSDDEASMDDEQMMQIDEKLAEVFKSRVDERKKGRGMLFSLSWRKRKFPYSTVFRCWSSARSNLLQKPRLGPRRLLHETRTQKRIAASSHSTSSRPYLKHKLGRASTRG